MVADEQRPVLVPAGPQGGRCGGRGLGRRQGGEPGGAPGDADPGEGVARGDRGRAQGQLAHLRSRALKGYYAARGVAAEVRLLTDAGDAAPAIRMPPPMSAPTSWWPAFGHPRLQEFIFGGTTRTLLGSDGPSLFLSH